MWVRRGRKGTDHAVFGGVRVAGRAGRRPHPRPLHRLVRLVLPHLAVVAGERGRESKGGQRRRSGDPFRSGLWHPGTREQCMTGWWRGDGQWMDGVIRRVTQAERRLSFFPSWLEDADVML
jgi:hypothetical protein